MTPKKPSHQGITSILRGREAGRMRPSLRLLRSAAVLIAAMLVGVISSAAAQAAPGDLDPTFSGDGKQTTNFGFGVSSAEATVRQPDGKIVAVGGAGGNFALARYNPNGTLDPSFSGDGRQTTDFGGDSEARAVALQGDGKIVVVGRTNGGFALARYNPDGSLDASFSGDGLQTTDFATVYGSNAWANGVAIQPDGKIVAVGSVNDVDEYTHFAVARYRPNGTLDPSFSGDGLDTVTIGAHSSATGVAIQPNGRIVVVGSNSVASGGNFVLVRYNSNGTLDATFSGDGRQTTNFGGRCGASDVALQGNGKIVAVGSVFKRLDPYHGRNYFAVARYNSNGSLDKSFSGDGRQTTQFVGDAGASDVAIQGSGKIVMVGNTANLAGNGDFAVARYNPNGTLDKGFSGDGRQTTDFFGYSDAAAGVALQGDGRIVAVGTESSSDFALARYNPNGSLDTTFSGDGKQTTNFGGGSSDGAGGVALQGDGKIVAVGDAGGHGSSDFGLARYNPDGSLDTTFSGDGRQTTSFASGGSGATGVALQGDGKIVAVGYANSAGNGDFALARYNPNGTLDKTFSGDGKQTTSFGGGYNGATGVALQGDGKIVVVGRAGGYPFDFALARYNPNGSLDASFSGDGKQTTDFGGDSLADGVALQGDGKIVAVGRARDPVSEDFALARYNPDGSPDASFSGDGKQTTNFGGVYGSDAAHGVALQGDGKIIAVGRAGNANFALARYNPDGSLDPTFSGDGWQTSYFGGGAAAGVAIQVDGKIVAVGSDYGSGGPSGFALARYNPDGSLDPSFSGDGLQTTGFGGSSGNGAAGVALQGDGKIVAVGAGRGPTQSFDFALVRYIGS